MRSCISSIKKLTDVTTVNNVNVRFYPRWTHRKPARVLTPEEYEQEEKQFSKSIQQPHFPNDNIIELNPVELNDVSNVRIPLKQNESFRTRNNESLVKNVKHTKPVFNVEELYAKAHYPEKESTKPDKKQNKEKIKYTSNEVLNTTFDKDGNYVYEKMKDNDSKIGTLMVMVKSRKLRQRKEFILVEGKRLIKDALEAGCSIQHLMFSRKSDLEYIRHLLPNKNIHLYKMAYRDIQMWSDLTTSPGIMAIFKTPNLTEINKKPSSTIPLRIICDNIREPGNLGAILRASVAVGSEKIVLTKGCVDIWEPKVLRSACGAHFRTSIDNDMSWPKLITDLPENTAIFLADNKIVTANKSSENTVEDLCLKVPVLPYYSVDFANCSSVALVIGGETMGLSQESYKLALDKQGVRLNIPLNNDIESLNTGTALGIIAFEIKRQLLVKK